MSPILSTYWRDLANGTRSGILDRLVLALLIPLALPYAMAQRLRARLYLSGILKSNKLPRPVVSVGNITVGGTGKTPVTAYIACHLMARGVKVAVLSRGYGGTMEGQTAIVSNGREIFLSAEECGDEPFLLAKMVPGLIVAIGADRHAAGLLAMERLSPDLFLLDDGFQHVRLHRDLNILLLDCTSPFGNGWSLPAGLLREPRSAAGRADLVIRTRCPDTACMDADAYGGKPCCLARHRLAEARPIAGGDPLPLESLRGRRVLAFAGIAEPSSFFEGLQSHGLNLVKTIAFPDHVKYGKTTLSELAAGMLASGAECAVTTEKDGVKLKQLPPELARLTLVAPLELTFDDPSPLTASLHNLLQK